MNRLDVELVARGLAVSREQARRWVEAGRITVSGVVVTKPSSKVDSEAVLEVEGGDRFVSRGGDKLEAALLHFEVPVVGLQCLDVGISTGGFADCLLQHGAARVVGVDVGHGQLSAKLRGNERIVLKEGLNARGLARKDFDTLFDLVVMDVSFIASVKILPAIPPLVAAGGGLLVLIKPQFELEPGMVGKGGIVKDPVLHQLAVASVENELRKESVWETFPVLPCPITGGDGNQEFLLWAKKKFNR
jgi:23S rRNA (cytidine1920-2'-O)/16S rRNA (cytidine1409-2'-O)-methyltransferase